MAHPALCGVARRAGAVRGRSALGIAHISALLSCRPNTHSPNLKASYSTQSDPASLSSEMVTYARRAWRGGDRSTACGVLEHGVDLITRAVAGQQGPVAVAAHAAKARTHLAWATMQSDSGELAHAHFTANAACAVSDLAGTRFVADRVVAHVAAAVAAARCHRANATSVVSSADPEGTSVPWDVLALEDHLEDAASAALMAEDATRREDVSSVSEKEDEALETGPGLEPCVDSTKHSKSLDLKYQNTPVHADAVALRIAMLGGRCAAASALNDADAACDAACDIHCQLEHAEWSKDEGWEAVKMSAACGPHGAAVASALKFAGHWTVLRGAGSVDGDDQYALAMRTYDRAEEVAKLVSASEVPTTATAALIADEIVADISLAKAQLALRVAIANFDRLKGENLKEDNDEVDDSMAIAETCAANAVTAAESLGYPDGDHPRVGLAISISADVYVAKAVLAAKGRGGVGDGAGVLFADGLYRNALHKFGTTRPPTAVASDADAAAGGAASSHLRLTAALIHAKYAAVLRASGANRASEADQWANAALKEWRDDFQGRRDTEKDTSTSSVIHSVAKGIGVVGKINAVLDGELMMPVVG